MKEQPDHDQEMRTHFASIEAEHISITTMKTPFFLPKFAARLQEILNAHGITIEKIKAPDNTGYCLFTFPPGTYKYELFPRTQAERYKVVLPDGFELCETKRRGEPLSYLQIDKSQLDPKK